MQQAVQAAADTLAASNQQPAQSIMTMEQFTGGDAHVQHADIIDDSNQQAVSHEPLQRTHMEGGMQAKAIRQHLQTPKVISAPIQHVYLARTNILQCSSSLVVVYGVVCWWLATSLFPVNLITKAIAYVTCKSLVTGCATHSAYIMLH